MLKSTIRIATLKELSLIDQLANKILSEFGLPKDSAVANLDRIYFHDSGELKDGKVCFWVALSSKDIIGSAAIVPLSGSTCIFKTFYVMKEFRSKGIGYALYTTAEQFAQFCNYRKIQLSVSRRFIIAKEFYLRNGYNFVEELTNIWEDSIYLKIL